jgi:single-strand DNA-binding protein
MLFKIEKGATMASYNRVIIMGNLTRDPDHRQIASGQSVCRLGLASNRQFKNRQTGAMVQEVCFVDVDVWGAQADSCNQYLQKGRPVLVEGRLKLDTWVDNDGQRRSKHSIVADRVTFLPAAGQQDSDFDFGTAQQPTEPKAAEPTKQAVAQPETPAPKVEAAKPEPKAVVEKPAPTGEVNLKDQAPFEDDLPF